MIVEDHRDTAETLAVWARSDGHDVCLCHTGFQAEQAAPAYRPDAVLLDIGLPDMDGWELGRLLKSTCRARIIAISAYQSQEDRRRSQDAGIDWHLGKPVQRDEVLGLLSQIADAE